MVDVVKALAGWKGVVGINVFKPTNSQKHSNRGAKGKKRLRVERQLWVINGNLWQESVVRDMGAIEFVKKLFKLFFAKKTQIFRQMEKDIFNVQRCSQYQEKRVIKKGGRR